MEKLRKRGRKNKGKLRKWRNDVILFERQCFLFCLSTFSEYLLFGTSNSNISGHVINYFYNHISYKIDTAYAYKSNHDINI